MILKGGYVYTERGFERRDIAVTENGTVSFSSFENFSDEIIDVTDKYIFPGFVDVHVHLREPGFIYKETVKSGTRAAAAGGYTTVFSMPNLSPVPDSLEHLRPQLEAIERDALVRVLPYGSLTVGQRGEELSSLEEMSEHVCAFSDDGKGVQSDEMMRRAMREAKRLGRIICAHCEDESLLHGGYIHDGEYARAHGHKGICSQSEWGQVKRDIELVRETGCAYHVCHVSTKESVELIRRAKKDGLDITCETAPHYLILCEDDLIEDGRFKMNPPLRTAEDREALIEGLLDGTVDMIATDHAPHSAEEKSRGLKGSSFGISGLEVAFPVLYTHLVKTGTVSLEKLVELMSVSPARRFGTEGGAIKEGGTADLCVFSLDKERLIDPAGFESMGKSTPFAKWRVYGQNLMTFVGGKVVWTRTE